MGFWSIYSFFSTYASIDNPKLDGYTPNYTRMNITDMPKQFLPLLDKPIIIHTLERFMQCRRIDALFVGVHGDWVDYMVDLVEKYFPQQKHCIFVVPGGKDRSRTMRKLITAIEGQFGQSDDNIVLTHDSVRPFVSNRIIEENIDAAIQFGATNTVAPAVDTIVVSTDGRQISSVPDRDTMFLGQSPQTFRLSELRELYNSLTEEEEKSLTEASRIYLMRGLPVYLVRGEPCNIKITTPADYKIAQAVAEDFFSMN